MKQVTRPMLGFKSFEEDHLTLVFIKLMHMLRKRQMEDEGAPGLSVAKQSYSLAS